MSDFPECEEFTGRKKDICRGEAGLPLCGPNSTNSYRKHWNKDPLPGDCETDRLQQSTTVASSRRAKPLVGDAMATLIAEYGLSAKSSCSCKSWAGKMNEWGIEGCREHRGDIINHLNEAYHAAKWWQKLQAAGKAVWHSLPLTLGGMVDEAIRRAETSPGN